MQEAQQHRFAFDDVDSATFRTFIQWMYTNKIYLGADGNTRLKLSLYRDSSDDDEYDSDESDNGSNSEPDEE